MRRTAALMLCALLAPLSGADAPPTTFGHMHDGRPCRWPGDRGIVVRWHVRAGFALQGATRDECRAAAVAAWRQWAAVADVRGEEAATEAAANVLIASGPMPGDRGPEVGAVCTYPCAAVGNRVDLVLDSQEPWDAAKLRRVIRHELGHALGLGHAPDEKAVMGPYWNLSDEAPGPLDRAGIVARYGPPRAR